MPRVRQLGQATFAERSSTWKDDDDERLLSRDTIVVAWLMVPIPDADPGSPPCRREVQPGGIRPPLRYGRTGKTGPG